MSDLPAGLFLLAGVLLLYGATTSGKGRLWITACFILGLALCFRWGFLLLYGLIPVAAYHGRHKAGARTLALAGIAFLVGAAPVLVYQHQTFGSAISTGYSFWLSEIGQVSGAFHALEEGIPVITLTARTSLDTLQPIERRLWREGSEIPEEAASPFLPTKNNSESPRYVRVALNFHEQMATSPIGPHKSVSGYYPCCRAAYLDVKRCQLNRSMQHKR